MKPSGLGFGFFPSFLLFLFSSSSLLLAPFFVGLGFVSHPGDEHAFLLFLFLCLGELFLQLLRVLRACEYLHDVYG